MTVPSITLNDGNIIPQYGFGVWQVSTDDITPAVAKALEVGYRHIDTAAIYGNEEGVGRAIAESGIAREDLWVTTKLWNARHQDARVAIEESLTRLGLDQVDLYLIHWPVPTQGHFLQAWESLVEIQRAGLTRSIGVSNFLPEHLDTIVNATGVKPTVNQIEIHPTFQQADLAAYTRGLGIAVEAYTPLGEGDFTLDAPRSWAEELGRTPAQVVLRWHLQKGHIVFPKSITGERIAENFDVFDFELPAEAMTALDACEAGLRRGGDPATFVAPGAH